MNPRPQGQGQPGQPGQPGQQGQPGQPGQVGTRLLRPEHLSTLPVLTQEEIAKYEEGLRSLWEAVRNNPPDSPAHTQAKHKIQEFSRMVYKKITSLQMRQQQQQQQQQQQGSSGGGGGGGGKGKKKRGKK